MNTKRYLALCEGFAPRVLASPEEYQEIRRRIAVLQSFTRDEQDDASTAYLQLLEKLADDFLVERFAMLRKHAASDSAILAFVLQLNPLTPEELFSQTGLTPYRVKEIQAGALFDRQEITILCDRFQLSPDCFDFRRQLPKMLDQLLTVLPVDGKFKVHLHGTALVRELPPSWLEIPVANDDSGDDSKYLTPADPAFVYYIGDWVNANQFEIEDDVFPQQAETRKKKAEATLERSE